MFDKDSYGKAAVLPLRDIALAIHLHDLGASSQNSNAGRRQTCPGGGRANDNSGGGIAARGFAQCVANINIVAAVEVTCVLLREHLSVSHCQPHPALYSENSMMKRRIQFVYAPRGFGVA